MIIKPNKAIGQKARYEEVNLEFYNQTCKITLTNKNKAEESGTLKEIKWITKDMIHLELIFSKNDGNLGDSRSKIIKLKEKSDVAKWVEPVCETLEFVRK